MTENKKKTDDDNPFLEEMPSVTRLLNRKSLKTGQTKTTVPAPAKPTAKPPATKPPSPPPIPKKPGK